jgi:hypothetical protein
MQPVIKNTFVFFLGCLLLTPINTLEAQTYQTPFDLDEFQTVSDVREYDYSKMTAKEIEHLSSLIDQRLLVVIKESYAIGLVEGKSKADIAKEYWCHDDDLLIELKVNLLLNKSHKSFTSRIEARQRIDKLISVVLKNKPQIPSLVLSESKGVDLDDLLKEMVVVDQYFAGLLLNEYRTIITALNKDGNEIVAFQHILKPYTCKGFTSLGILANQILDEHGWPDKSVGENASYNLWLIYQHQDANIDWQKRALALMKEKVDSGVVSKINYAYLYDRVALNDGRRQRFGTQLKNCGLRPVENEEELDLLRDEMGLGPIEEYISSSPNCDKSYSLD